ncbi:hypothetical protein OK349_13260 [Sphingomonas sp. BT-65]|uniref:hypothetical protein n=1 Tax=Sphingomonas sp. BT-65 TaxID=2989821 RepID=UPI0022358970|nr:hypothetical protein [Sphingomonas sp. BT-65]MCW4462680.1 hypothetical protein [Sphingomonas sp. BT-65]
MTAITQTKQINWWRVARWSAAAVLLCVPAIAMRFTSEVDWTASDFVVMGMLFASILGAYDFLASRAPSFAYRAASVLTTLGLFLLIWINLAVGVIGSENNDANLMFAAVIAIIVGGACIARFKPAGMGRALLTAAAVQLVVGVIAVAGDLGADGPIWPRDVIVLTAFFAGLWVTAGTLFRMATRDA